MKKKAIIEQPAVDPALMASAKKYVFDAKPRATFGCRVCKEPGASDESEGLCWVCRRLKISAWRDTEAQMPMSE